MSINEVFTFTGFGKILLGPGNLYSEKLHSTASTEREAINSSDGRVLWLKMSTKRIYRLTAARKEPLYFLFVDFRPAFEH
jgi:hypothetical protein